jgi:hypothetical protein
MAGRIGNERMGAFEREEEGSRGTDLFRQYYSMLFVVEN